MSDESLRKRGEVRIGDRAERKCSKSKKFQCFFLDEKGFIVVRVYFKRAILTWFFED